VFGVCGHSWASFHLFCVIEFAGVLPLGLATGLIGAVSAFVAVMGYECVSNLAEQLELCTCPTAIEHLGYQLVDLPIAC